VLGNYLVLKAAFSWYMIDYDY